MSNKVPYTILPNELLNIGLSSGAIHLALYMYSNSKKWEYHNNAVCKKLDISERTLSKYWKELIDNNVISRTRKCINGFANGGFDYEILMTVENEVLHDRKNCDLDKKAIIEDDSQKLSAVDLDHFDYIWKNYELAVLVNTLGRNSENKTKVKASFHKLVKLKISPKLIEDYVLDYYEECTDQKYLKGLINLLSDVDTLKEKQKEYNANNK